MADKYDNYNGMRFCSQCDNIMKPTNDYDGSRIYFRCRNHGKVKIELDQENKEDFLMKKSVLQQSSAANIYDKNMVLDPTMKTVEKKCPECGYMKAVCYLGTDVDQRKIISYYICARLSDDKFVPACAKKHFTDEDIENAKNKANKDLLNEDQVDEEDVDEIFGDDM